MITAKQFIAHFEGKHDLAFVEQDGRLHVLGGAALSAHERTVIAGHEPELLAALRGQDIELRPAVAAERFAALGFVQTELGWVHPDGDAVGDRVLAGLIDFDEAEQQAAVRDEQRRRETFALTGDRGPKPKPVEVEAEQVRPGTFRWVEQKGQHVVPVHQGRRLD